MAQPWATPKPWPSEPEDSSTPGQLEAVGVALEARAEAAQQDGLLDAVHVLEARAAARR